MQMRLTGLGPPTLEATERAARDLGFEMSCTEQTGMLLAFLAAAKPGGRLLELGTGTGYGTAWLAGGMTSEATLTTVEIDDPCHLAARAAIGPDPRIRWVNGDAAQWLVNSPGSGFDLIFADCWPGKFSHLDEALALLAVGGLYVVDDLDPQPGWLPGHAEHVGSLLSDLRQRPNLAVLTLPLASGVAVATRT